jgi:hypothetical protein
MIPVRACHLRLAALPLLAIATLASAQPTATALETRAFQLGAEAAALARADAPNTETIVGQRYRQVLELSADPAIQPHLREAFQRGYQSGVSGAPAPSGGPRLLDVTMAHDVADGRPVRPSDVFTPDDHPIHVWFRHEAVPVGAAISSDWFYDESTPAVHITHVKTLMEPGAVSTQFRIELEEGKPWPVGKYRVELRVDDQMLAEARFRVAAAEPPTAGAGAPRRYVHPATGYQFVPPEGWSLNDQVTTADVQMKAQQGDGVIEITSGPVSTRLDPVSYAAGWESNAVGPGRLLRVKRAGRMMPVDGEPGYAGVYEGDGVLVKVLFVGVSDRFFVMTGIFPSTDFAAGEATFDRFVSTFRPKR